MLLRDRELRAEAEAGPAAAREPVRCAIEPCSRVGMGSQARFLGDGAQERLVSQGFRSVAVFEGKQERGGKLRPVLPV